MPSRFFSPALWLMAAGLATAAPNPARGASAPEKPKAGPAKAPAPRSLKSAQAAKPKAAGWKIVDHRGLAYVDMNDVAVFFGFDSPVRDGRRLLLKRDAPQVEFRLQTGSKLVSLNKLRLYLSYPVAAGRSGNLLLSAFDLVHVIDPILRPDQQRDPSQLKTVVIDPARGGDEDGITSRFGREKEITLEIAMTMRSLLESAGYQVFLTREADIGLDVSDRLLLANSQRDEAIFVSLHCSHGGEDEHGVESFTLAPCGTPSTSGDEGKTPDQKFYPGNINDRESMALATAIQGAMVTTMKATDLGIRRARFDELKGIAMPAVVCSVGRLAHATEGKSLGGDPKYRERMAQAVVTGIERYARVMASGSVPGDRLLKFGSVQVFPDKVRSVSGEQVRVRAAILKTDPAAVIDPSAITLQVYFVDSVNHEEIDLSTCDTPPTRWVSVMPDWREVKYEEVEFLYQQPAFDEAMMKTLGLRTYYGFVLRLVYHGELMDEYAEPANLKRGLGNFAAVLPRRG